MNTVPKHDDITGWFKLLRSLKEESGAADVTLVFHRPDGTTLTYSADESIGDENELDYTGMELPQ